MPCIDLSNWKFEHTRSRMADVLGKPKLPPLEFPTSIDLLHYLAGDNQANIPWIQGCIGHRINKDPTAQAWRRKRTPLNALHHFSRYRKNKFDEYHLAAEARCKGTATSKQLELANGLELEIDASKIMVPAGQMLFHGRADYDLSNCRPYPKFLSTSLNPIVARQSAFRRSGLHQVNGRPIVYVLTLDCCLPALWGQTGSSAEYELLLPPQLTVEIFKKHTGQPFDLVEAKVICRG